MKQLDDRLQEFGITEPENQLEGKTLRKYKEFKKEFFNKSSSHVDYRTDRENPKRRSWVVQKLKDLFEDIITEVQINDALNSRENTESQEDKQHTQGVSEKEEKEEKKNTDKKSGGLFDLF